MFDVLLAVYMDTQDSLGPYDLVAAVLEVVLPLWSENHVVGLVCVRVLDRLALSKQWRYSFVDER